MSKLGEELKEGMRQIALFPEGIKLLNDFMETLERHERIIGALIDDMGRIKRKRKKNGQKERKSRAN